uniref:Uncharacterized protein n=1 Tax=viral metagenome TaxID=1070528 RepID=A0A6C0JXK5_9ZZZZ
MDSLSIATIIVCVIVGIYAVATAIYLHSMRSTNSSTSLTVLFWSSIAVIAVLAALIVYSIYTGSKKEKTSKVKVYGPDDSTKVSTSGSKVSITNGTGDDLDSL